MGDPPSFVGAVHDSVACEFPGMPVNDVGVFGTASVDSVTIAYAPLPTAFTAATLKSYNVASSNTTGLNPVTMQWSDPGVSGMGAGVVVAVNHVPVSLTLHCTVYDVMEAPPSDNGGSHVKDTLLTPD